MKKETADKDPLVFIFKIHILAKFKINILEGAKIDDING